MKIFRFASIFICVSGLVLGCAPPKQGKRGPMGPAGSQGEIGATGAQGTPGASGNDGAQGAPGTPGDPGKPGTSLDGKSSGGGGGFLHTKSKPLLDDAVKRTIALLKNSSEEVFAPLGPGWKRQQLIEIFETIKKSPKLNRSRNETDRLVYDYGYENGKPFLEVLEPFFDHYSTVQLRGPKGEYYYRIQTEIIIELFHELSHLVLNHPTGEVSPEEVGQIEVEAKLFAETLFKALVSEAIICSTKFSKELVGLPPAIETPENTEYAVWAFSKYSRKSALFKVGDPQDFKRALGAILSAPISIDDFTYKREDRGVLGKVSDDFKFPPSPKFQILDKRWQEAGNLILYPIHDPITVEGEGEGKVKIHRYDIYREPKTGRQMGLIEVQARMGEILNGASLWKDENLRDHNLQFDGSGFSYFFSNQFTNQETDPRTNQTTPYKQVREDEVPLDCQPVVSRYEITTPWPDR